MEHSFRARVDCGEEKKANVRVSPLPGWLDIERFLGSHSFQLTPEPGGAFAATASLAVSDASFLAARLRGLGLDGHALSVEVTPSLSRALVREGRLREARARRTTTPGFLRAGTRAVGPGRFSLTPESLALALGREANGRSVVDACCGSGGNAIGFARAGCSVVAIDVDPERLQEAQHNAKLFGVGSRIQFIEGDALGELGRLSTDLLFVDPPWGEDYDKRHTRRESFPLLDRLLALLPMRFGAVWMKLPASFATASVPGAVPRAWFGEAAGDRERIKFIQLSLATHGS